jgi:STE24 endopeptidase
VHGGMIFSKTEFFFPALLVSFYRRTSAEGYLLKKIMLTVANLGLTFIYVFFLTFTGFKDFFINLSYVGGNVYIQFLIFIFSIGIFLSIIKFPLDYYAEFVVEHRFRLSDQRFRHWLLRKSKEAVVGSVLGVVILLVFYSLLVHLQVMWWLVFGAFFFLFQIGVVYLFPSTILPMFYKLRPLFNDELFGKLNGLVEKCGFVMNGVFVFDLSRETRKANAALTGFGKTKKIIISDTLLQNFSHDEIEVVMAHELGHLAKHHVIRGVIVSGVMSFMSFYVMARLYSAYTAATQVAVYSLRAIPFLAFVMMVLGIIGMPIGNFYSRMVEREADRFALDVTGKRREFVNSMRKLGELNLIPENPPAWVEKIFFSHPSIGARIRYALGEQRAR